ncbi:hypothetical protein [Elizabethkingia anophelis]|uniref:Mobile element protein n=1 Tax=Elizabethkingia anophelis TaxID=1117645 RepID=A0AAU8UXW1_9FLAO|nr:hypothetical protein [Elizabethkingia anophelis]AQX01084.1 hypothetical protein BBD32_06245 [Elizabethkingia anophelis]MCW2464637.1 hypothetical protein [Elizabethkingia anophelis]MCW2468320.1 hypothetical protein [Elizabethkingia anophelis]MCW2472004.1 hypothetical protein [Elizabethkingia anophelis]MYY42510.1 hypothetical protein [Elizabethkingia anophelis]
MKDSKTPEALASGVLVLKLIYKYLSIFITQIVMVLMKNKALIFSDYKKEKQLVYLESTLFL